MPRQRGVICTVNESSPSVTTSALVGTTCSIWSINLKSLHYSFNAGTSHTLSQPVLRIRIKRSDGEWRAIYKCHSRKSGTTNQYHDCELRTHTSILAYLFSYKWSRRFQMRWQYTILSQNLQVDLVLWHAWHKTFVTVPLWYFHLICYLQCQGETYSGQFQQKHELKSFMVGLTRRI